MARIDPQFMLRIPEPLRDEVKAAAEANGRSMTSEILRRLEACSVGSNKQVHPALHKVGEIACTEPGITLREQFAGLAMQGMLASQGNGGEYYRHNEIAKEAVWYADALIAELSKGGAA